MPTRYLLAAAAAACVATVPTDAGAEGEVVRIKRNPSALILDAARVNAGADMLYVSGQLPSPLDPAMPMSEVDSLEDMGDTRAQTLSILTKMKATLEGMGLGMGDIVKMNVFLVAPTPGGRMDSAAMNEVFKTFFGTPEQPNKPTRTTVQVAALGRPTTLVEIEAIAAKAP